MSIPDNPDSVETMPAFHHFFERPTRLVLFENFGNPPVGRPVQWFLGKCFDIGLQYSNSILLILMLIFR